MPQALARRAGSCTLESAWSSPGWGEEEGTGAGSLKAFQWLAISQVVRGQERAVKTAPFLYSSSSGEVHWL